MRTYLKIFAALLTLLAALGLPRQAAAFVCPLEISEENAVTVVTAPGGAKFKIEDQFIKTLLPSAFDKDSWTFARLGGGAGKITGILETKEGDKVVSVMIGLKREAKTDWYIVINSDLEQAKGRWIVAASINGEFKCSETATFDSAAIDEGLLQRFSPHHAKLKVIGAGLVYGRLGL